MSNLPTWLWGLGVSTVIFDVDGTLLDSAPGIVDGIDFTLRELGIEPPGTETLMGDIGPSLDSIMARYGVPTSRRQEGQVLYRIRYLSVGASKASVYDGIREILDRLRSEGFRLATATMKREPAARAVLEHQGLDAYFEVVGCADQQERTNKAEILQWTLGQLETEPGATDHVVMIGDRHFDISGATQTGLRSVGAAWGYGTRSELLAAGATWIADRPVDLAAG